MSRNDLLRCLGGPWPVLPPPTVSILETRRIDRCSARLLRYESGPSAPGESPDTVEAWLLFPDPLAGGESPRPGMLVWHQHNDEFHLGKSEPAGLAGVQGLRNFILLCLEQRDSPALPAEYLNSPSPHRQGDQSPGPQRHFPPPRDN